MYAVERRKNNIKWKSCFCYHFFLSLGCRIFDSVCFFCHFGIRVFFFTLWSSSLVTTTLDIKTAFSFWQSFIDASKDFSFHFDTMQRSEPNLLRQHFFVVAVVSSKPFVGMAAQLLRKTPVFFYWEQSVHQFFFFVGFSFK